MAAYNGKIPGPPIVICEGDELVVNLKNDFEPNGENTTLHFHGIGEVYTPWKDGVPWVTQYPVLPGNSFTYGFNASVFFGAPPGTYWYHSHVLDQRVNGAYGALIIKPKNIVPDERFDIDNADNTIIVQEWYEDENNDTVRSLLINGKGRVANDSPGYMVYNVSSENRYIFRVIGAIGQNFPLRLSIDNHNFTAIAADSKDIESVEELTDLWIASGERFDIVVQTKPRDQTQEKAYKIRVFGYENPFNQTGNFCTIAWLKYEHQEIISEFLTESDCSSFVIKDLYPYLRTLNPVPNNFDEWQKRMKFPQWTDKTIHGDIFVKDLIGKVQNPTLQLQNQSYLNTQYKEFGNETFDNITMEYPELPFLLQDGSYKGNRCGEVCKFTVDSAHCNPTLTYLRTSCASKLDAEGCQFGEPCNCSHVMQQPYAPGYWFDMILINGGVSPETAHPIHKHGGWFAVVGMDMFNRSIRVDREFIKHKDEDCDNYRNHYIPCLPRNFIYPPEKDTIQVPTNGYVILRIPTNNAGTWLMHCHINWHFQKGMAMVIQLGAFHEDKNDLQKWCTKPII